MKKKNIVGVLLVAVMTMLLLSFRTDERRIPTANDKVIDSILHEAAFKNLHEVAKDKTPKPGPGTRKYLTNMGSWGAYYTAGVNFNVIPGDTLVVNNINAIVTMALEGFRGTADNKIVIINEGSDSTSYWPNFKLVNCGHIKITGSGQSAYYGFVSNGGFSGLDIAGNSEFIEIERIRFNGGAYAMRVKNDPSDFSCNPAYWYPNGRIRNIYAHNLYAYGQSQDPFYFGNTDPIGSRPTCGQPAPYPIPTRLANIEIAYVTVDSAGRTGIQISGSDSGYNKIHDCRVTRTGYELNQTQGGGILNGGSVVNIEMYNNYLRRNFQAGISAGINGNGRVEGNDIDSSGWITVDNFDKLRVTNTDTSYHYIKAGGGSVNIKFVYTATKVSGTLGGIAYVIASGDGVSWSVISDTFNIANTSGIQKKLFNVTTNFTASGSEARFKIITKQSGTCVADYRTSVWNDIYPFSIFVGRNVVYPYNGTPQSGRVIVRNNICGSTDDENYINNNGRNISISGNQSDWNWTGISTVCGNTKQNGSAASILFPTSGFQYTTSCITTPTPPVVTTSDTVTLYPPTNTSVNISGTAYSPNGANITGYSWSKLTGGSATIATPTSASTAVTGLSAGTYKFELTATDENSLTGKDTVTVIVSAVAPVSAYGYYRAITIDRSKVANTVQDNFPVLVSGTFPYLKTVANGGRVTNSNGYDIVFTTDIVSQTKLKWEVEKYDPTTGELIAWVKMDGVSPLSDKTFYIQYGNSNISTFQGDVTNTWSNGYAAVYHLKNGTTLSGTDVTTNAYNGTINSATATTGQIDGAGSFASGSNISIPSLMSNPSSVTLSGWVNLTTNGGVASEVISMGDHVALRVNQTTFGTGVSGFYYTGTSWPQINGGSPILNTGWHYVAYSVTANDQRVYLDGTQVNIGSSSSAISWSGLGTATKIGIHGNGATNANFGGKIDEPRVSNTIRSGDWLKTEYNNQSSPSTFYSVSAETNFSSGNAAPPVVNAGTDQVINQPTSSVTLSGTATDEGSIVSTTWSKVSGTGSTISFQNNLTTGVTGLSAGTYVFRLSATDNDGNTVTDDVQVIVNQLPTVEIRRAGVAGNQTIVSPKDSIRVYAVASDPDGSIASYNWQQTAGTTATITGGTTSSIAVTGIAVGAITLVCTVTDNRGATSTNTIIVTRNATTVTRSNKVIIPIIIQKRN